MAKELIEVYARALVELAHEQGVLPDVEAAAHAFAEAMDRDRNLHSCILNPGIDRHEKRRVLVEKLDPILPRVFVDFLAVVVEKGRACFLPHILSRVRAVADEVSGRIRVSLVTAVPAGSEERDAVAAALRARLGAEIVMEERVDPSIVGGMIVRYRDCVIDGSVQGELRRLRDRLVEKPLGSEYIA